jgi:hypothetical protein
VPVNRYGKNNTIMQGMVTKTLSLSNDGFFFQDQKDPAQTEYPKMWNNATIWATLPGVDGV